MNEKLKEESEKILKEYEQVLQENERDIKLYTFENLKNIETTNQKWVVERLIPERSLVLLAGKRASFKSWVALEMVKSVSTGQSFLGKFPVRKVGVWYMDEENGIEMLKERLEKLVNDDEKLENVYFSSFEGIKLDKLNWFEKLKEKLKEHPEIKLLIIDSFRRISEIDENDAGAISDFLTSRLRPLCLEYGLTIILIHHLRKSLGKNPADEMDEVRGSSDLANYSDVVLILERPKGSQNRIILKQVKSRRSPELEPLLIEIDWSNNKVKFTCQGSALDYLNDVERCKHQILVWIEESNITTFTTKEVNEAMKTYGFSSKTTQRALAELVAQGKIIKIRRGVYARPSEALISFVNNETKTKDKTQLQTERTNIYDSSVHLSITPKKETENENGQMDNKDSVPSVHLSKSQNRKEGNGQMDKTYNIVVPSIHLTQAPLKSKDKTKKEQKGDKPRDKSENVSYWDNLERDYIEVVRNPPLGKLVQEFEILSFLVQRGYKEEDIRKVHKKLMRDGIVVQTPDGSIDINWSKWRGDD